MLPEDRAERGGEERGAWLVQWWWWWWWWRRWAWQAESRTPPCAALAGWLSGWGQAGRQAGAEVGGVVPECDRTHAGATATWSERCKDEDESGSGPSRAEPEAGGEGEPATSKQASSECASTDYYLD